MEGRTTEKLLEEIEKPMQFLTIFDNLRIYGYHFQLLICHLYLVLNPICQLFILNKIFNHTYWNLGPRVFEALMNGKAPYFANIFPIFTQCAFNNFGLSSAVAGSFHLCFLKFNKVLIILFTIHWFIISLSVIFNAFSFINICLLMVIPRYRVHVLFKRSACNFEDLKSVCFSINIDQFHLLSNVERNVSNFMFRKIIETAAEKCVLKEIKIE